MVTIWEGDPEGHPVALASELRSQRLRVDLYPDTTDKLGKQFKYAAARGIPFVAIVGDDERLRDEVSIKNMASGEQQTYKRSEVAAAVRSLLK